MRMAAFGLALPMLRAGHHNLGPAAKVAGVLLQWLASIDDAENSLT